MNVSAFLRLSLVLACALATARCGSPSDGAVKPSAASAPASTSAPAADAAAAAPPHGDHSPHHGGTVLMAGDLHYEIVLKPAGGAELYLSDAVRKDLPASIVSDVAIEIDRPSKGAKNGTETKTEQIDMAIDSSGERWEGAGTPVKDADAIVRVAFTFQAEPVTVDLPYRSYFKQASTSGASTGTGNRAGSGAGSDAGAAAGAGAH